MPLRSMLFVMATLIVVPSCTPPQIEPPAAPQHERTMTFEKPFDEVWTAVVDWFSESNIPIQQIERASGLIASEHRLGADEGLIDCGSVSSGDWTLVDSSRTANMNVRVREAGAGVTVTADVFGRGSYTFANPMSPSNRQSVPVDRCESTGGLEAALFEYISDG